MQEQLGLNSNLNVGARRLHIQTSFSGSTSTIIANIFDNGRVVEAREIHVSSGEINGDLDKRIREIHQSIVSDIELLFYVSEKVRQVKHAVSCNKLGLVFLNRGFLEEAIQFFTLAVEVEKNFAEAYANLGRCYFKKNELERAEEIFVEGLSSGKKYADLHLNLGTVYIARGKYIDAVKAIENALELNPSYFEAHYNMAVALLHSLIHKIDYSKLPPVAQRRELIEEHLQKAAQLFKPFKNQSWKQGMTALEAEDFEIALKCYQRAFKDSLEKMDLTFDHEFYLKFMYGGKGKDNQFIGAYVEELKAAIDAYPEYADLHNNLGIAYLIMCRNLFLKALDEFRRALKINPGFKRASKNLKLAENDGKGFLILLRALLK